MAIGEDNVANATFWGNLTAERIYSAMENTKAAATRLQQFIIWVFGIFSTLTFTGVIFAKKEDWSALALLALGLALAMFVYAYWLSIKSSYPFEVSVQVGNEDSEREAYEKTITKIRYFLSRSFGWCAAGTIFYALGILIQFGYPLFCPRETAEKELSMEFKNVPEKRMVALHLTAKKNSWVTVFLETDTTINQKKQTTLAFDPLESNGKMVYVDTSGSALVNLKYQNCTNVFLKVEKSDTLKNGGDRKTVIRTKIFQVPPKSTEPKKPGPKKGLNKPAVRS